LRFVELDHAFSGGLLERLEDGLAIAVGGRDDLRGRPGQRRDLEQDIHRLGRQPGQSTAEQLLQALRHS
jgi:hypothetical protein